MNSPTDECLVNHPTVALADVTWKRPELMPMVAPKRPTMKRFHVYAREDVLEELGRLAYCRGESVASLVRRLIHSFVNSQRRNEQG